MTPFVSLMRSISVLACLLWVLTSPLSAAGLQTVPKALDMAAVPKGLSWERPLKVINHESVPISLLPALTSDGRLFSVDSADCSRPLAPMDSCLLWVSFRADRKADQYTSDLRITYTAASADLNGVLEVPLTAAVSDAAEGWFELGESDYQAVLEKGEARSGVLLGLSADVGGTSARVQVLGAPAPFAIPVASPSPTYAEATVALKPVETWRRSSAAGRKLTARVHIEVSAIRFWTDLVQLKTVPLGQCRGAVPVPAMIELDPAREHLWARGKDLEIVFRWPEFENCSFYTTMLNDELAERQAWVVWRIRPFLENF